MKNGSGNKLTIGLICHSHLGGSSRVACRLANALARRDHDVHMFSLHCPFWPPPENVRSHFCFDGPSDFSVDLDRDWPAQDRNAFKAVLKQHLGQVDFDILHFHYALPFAHIMRELAHQQEGFMPPIVGTLHGTDVTQTGASESVGAALARCDLLTAVSAHLAWQAKQSWPALNEIQVVPNFVEAGWAQEVACSGEFPQPQKPVILHVSNFRPVKNTGLLVQIFEDVWGRMDAELWLVGDGPERLPVIAALEAKGLAGSVRSFGPAADTAAFFKHADLVLSTSHEEGFGLVCLEAMAAGVPLVASDVGGIRELAGKEEVGILFDPLLPDLIAKEIVELLGSADRLAQLGKSARARALHFDEDSIVSRHEQLYRSLLP